MDDRTDRSHQSRAPVCVGIDVGGTKLNGGVVDIGSGAILTRHVRATEAGRTPGAILDDVVALAEELLGECRESTGAEATAVGLAIAEIVDPNGDIASEYTFRWRDLPVRARLARLAPTHIESDIRAGAVAEATFGAGQSLSSFGYVAIGTGIGSTLIVDGTPLVGAHGAALVISTGEIPLDCVGLPGRRFVLERYASGAAVVERYNEATGECLARTEEVVAHADAGHRVAREVLETAGRAAGAGVAYFANLTDPAAIVLGGGLGSACVRYYHDAFEESFRRFVWHEPAKSVPIECAVLAGDAPMVGAALTAGRKET